MKVVVGLVAIILAAVGIPAVGDVGWVIDGAWQPYFRGTIAGARYQ